MTSVKRIFAFSGQDHADEFARQGYILIRNGVDPDFLDYATRQLDTYRHERENISGRYDKRGLKEQYLFEFPDDEAVIYDAVDRLGRLTGLDADELVLSERHFKVYQHDADPSPPPHKDRKSSQIAVGLPIAVPDASRVIIFPDHERWENPYDSYDELLRSLPEERLPEKVLDGVKPVEIETRRGDVFVFQGASMYHERINSAGSMLLYLKWNVLDLDPIGENLSLLPRSRVRATQPV